jgi:hypothetical protein
MKRKAPNAIILDKDSQTTIQFIGVNNSNALTENKPYILMYLASESKQSGFANHAYLSAKKANQLMMVLKRAIKEMNTKSRK